MKVVIVGGVAGGATAATRLRRLDEHAQITVFERSGYISYANCGLPYYIGGVIEDKEELTLQTPESIWNRFRIDMKVHHEVTDINAVKKTVTVYNLDTGKVYEESYDKLILSPGAKPIKPNLPGIDNDKIFTLRTVEDTLKIRSFVEEKKPKTAVMVGGGFIGLEVAENLCDLGVKVTVVQRPKQLMNTLDYDMATLVHNKLRSKGISLKLGGDVIGFEEKEQLQVLLKDDEPISTDMVLMAIGVSPETTLAKKAGLELGIKGAIVVDASSGHVRYYRREKVPKWVDRVYPAELIYKQLENSGKYSGGFFNNYLSQKGVLKPTKGYSYLAIDDDIYMYTGFTSVSGDSSNVGFALVNMRTKKAKFYPIAGATEASAMKSAKGKVENYGYDATFPILLNVDNVPSYFLSLKDEEGLVKKYAFVSVENYEIVGIGDSVKEARENYMKLINDSGHAKIKTLTNKTEGKIVSIKEVVVDGNTTYYFTLENDTKTYIASIKVNPQLPLSKAGDEVKLTYLDDSNEAKTVTKLIFITTKS